MPLNLYLSAFFFLFYNDLMPLFILVLLLLFDLDFIVNLLISDNFLLLSFQLSNLLRIFMNFDFRRYYFMLLSLLLNNDLNITLGQYKLFFYLNHFLLLYLLNFIINLNRNYLFVFQLYLCIYSLICWLFLLPNFLLYYYSLMAIRLLNFMINILHQD
jgi:hypothetical protein